MITSSDDVPVHNYHWARGKTVLWDTTDSESAWVQNCANSQQRNRLLSLGYLDRSINYCFNSEGFRNEEFDQSFDAACFGCSFTMGTGLAYSDTWPQQLAKFANITTANLAHAGSSNDTALRMALWYLPRLKPKYALWLQTDSHRLEILNDASFLSTNILANDIGGIYKQDNFVKQWFASKSNQQLNLEKNTRAFRNLCNELNIVCIILPRNAVVVRDLARDLKHPGILSNLTIAEKFANGL